MSEHVPELLPEGLVPDSEARAAIDLATRSHQIYPVLSADDIGRMRRFGTCRTWPDGATVFRACVDSPGMVVVLAGRLLCSRTDALGKRVEVVEYGPGQFSGEVAQLSGRPPLADGVAVGELEALVLDAECLRAVIVAEAELGERLMRAFILRRVQLIQQAGRPHPHRSAGACRPVRAGEFSVPECLPVHTARSRHRSGSGPARA